MLTIKHQTPYGNEALYEATNVQFCPVEGVRSDMPAGTYVEQLGALYYRGANGNALEEIGSGMVYVMNGEGSTIGKYDLGGWAVGNTVAAAA